MNASSRPYLLKALYEWIVDNGQVPHLVVDTTIEGVQVPEEYIEDDRITLNVNPSAVQNFMLENEFISFNARFAGTPRDLYIPLTAVTAIFDRVHGLGMAFSEEDMCFPEGSAPQPPPSIKSVPSPNRAKVDKAPSEKKASHLRVIK